MKRSFLISAVFSIFQLFCGAHALAQTTYTTPQSQQAKIFNAVTSAQSSGCLTNQGQNIWFSNYTTAGGSATLEYRLEYSYNSDSATCTTGTWFAMSDDATDSTQGEVIGIGAYPFVRANLVMFSAGGGITFTSFYTTSSSSPIANFGFYNPGQQTRRVPFVNIAANVNNTSNPIGAPYSSAAGVLLVAPLSATFSGASIAVATNYGSAATSNVQTFNLANNGNAQAFLIAATPATSVTFTYVHGATASGNVSVYWLAFPPGGAVPNSAQPPQTQNSETVSATNAAATVTINPGIAQSVTVFSVSARCSAGTAQLTITDTTASNTQIWSTGSTEVGTSTFKYQWAPGLNVSISPGDAAKVQLGTCGVGNTGTLDVQESIF